MHVKSSNIFITNDKYSFNFDSKYKLNRLSFDVISNPLKNFHEIGNIIKYTNNKQTTYMIKPIFKDL